MVCGAEGVASRFQPKLSLVARTAGLTILPRDVFMFLSITDQWRVSIGYSEYGLQCTFGQGYFIFNSNLSKQVCCCNILWKDVRHFTNILSNWACSYRLRLWILKHHFPRHSLYKLLKHGQRRNNIIFDFALQWSNQCSGAKNIRFHNGEPDITIISFIYNPYYLPVITSSHWFLSNPSL